MSDRIAVMSSGQILQIGSPREIYDKPAERFVADFIGETNFLPSEVVSVDTGRAKVKLLSGATIEASVADGFAPSGKVTVVVRPEHARIALETGELAGLVENVVYFGTDTNVHLRLDDGTPFVVRRQNSRGVADTVEVGQRAGIAIDAGAAQVLKD